MNLSLKKAQGAVSSSSVNVFGSSISCVVDVFSVHFAISATARCRQVDVQGTLDRMAYRVGAALCFFFLRHRCSAVAFRVARICNLTNHPALTSLMQEKWCRLTCFLEDDLQVEARSMINDAVEKGEPERADDVETWLTIMNASTKLLLLAIDITSHRNAFVVSTKDIEGAWDALRALSCRLPCCGTFLLLDELESEAPDTPGEGEGSDATVDEEYDPTEDVSCSSDDEDDDVSDCGEDSDSDGDQGFPGSWSSDPALSDREEDEEQDEGDEQRDEGKTDSSSDFLELELLESEGAHGSSALAPDMVNAEGFITLATVVCC